MKYYNADTCELNKEVIIEDLKLINDYLKNDCNIDECFNMFSEITASLLLYSVDRKMSEK